MSLHTIDFRSIRDHNGSQHGGFEELLYQLIPAIDDVGGRKVIRHGNPDGGVEAHVQFEDGNVSGWQAKYFFQFGQAQVRQMKRSLDSALAAWPTLSRYTFAFPTDPPSGGLKGTTSAAEKITNAFALWESEAAEQGRQVSISYVGGSQITNVLMDEKHVGKVLYWFDQRLLFSSDWLRKQLDWSISAAGPRYTPEVNVDLDVGFAFDGLGRTEEFDARLGKAVADLRRATQRARLRSDEPAPPRRLRSALNRVTDHLDALTQILGRMSVRGTAPIDWAPHIDQVDKTRRCIAAISELTWRRLERVDVAERQSGSAQRNGLHRVRDALSWLDEPLELLADLLKSEAARLVVTPSLFLIGDAGTGKTHLLCDMARRRLEEGRPTVLVMGQQLGEGDPRKLVLDQLELTGMSMEQFLAALDAAGEAAGTRALLMIDAINEGGGLSMWPSHLRAFANQVAGYGRVGLVVSCRSSYVPGVLSQESAEAIPETLGFVQVEHPGFANHEWKAAGTFFEHWGLSAPDFPLLVPEYSNPLFLKLLCTSLSSAGEKTLPRGATGVTRLFERFLGEANRRLSDRERCNYRQDADPVAKVITTLAQAMLEANEDRVPYATFDAACKEALPDRAWDKSLAKGLLDEGVVSRDWFGNDEVVRLSYQRLGDHRQAAHLIENTDDAGLRDFLAELESDDAFYRRTGLLEALAIQLPERLGIELHSLIAKQDHPMIQEAFLGSILWRDPASFDTEQSSDYVNSIANDMMYRSDFIETVLQVTCVPGHPFNADRLDDVLAAMTMPDRDAWWTTHISDSLKGESVAWRLVDWARSPQQRATNDETATLAATTLSWFLASSNRALRDCATKALVSLLRERIPRLVNLLSRFRTVDDPYIAERLYCAAYGCALSSTDDPELRTLAGAVYDNVFASGRPPTHVLLRDYARGVVERAASEDALPSRVDIDLVRPPYESSWPVRLPSEETLERKAPRNTYGALWASLSGTLGDFGRYTVGRAVKRFEAPNQQRRRRERHDKEVGTRQAAADELEELLSTDQRQRLPKHVDHPAREAEFVKSLDYRELLLRSAAQRNLTPPDQPVMWPAAGAARWIFGRVLGLGWTPERFGYYDDSVRGLAGHSERPRIERIGKKYQWIALHELLARIADHCRYWRWDTANIEPFDGPWQLGLRDIDPSVGLEPVPIPWFDSPQTWWQGLAVQAGPFADGHERSEWVGSTADAPSPDDVKRLLLVEGSDGTRWLTIEGAYNWGEEVPPQLQDAPDARAGLWLQIRSYLVPWSAFADFKEWAHRQDWAGRWMPEGDELSQVFLGEWPWHPSAGLYAEDQVTIERPSEEATPAPSEVAPTCVTYTFAKDASLPEGVLRRVPASTLIQLQALRPRAGSFEFEDRDGHLAALDPSVAQQGSSALLYNEALLRRLLGDEDRSLAWTILGEKEGGDYREGFLVIYGVAALKSGGADIEIEMMNRQQPVG